MNRDESLKRIRESPAEWDFLVIGGGASGLGTAVEAAARDYRTVLVEQSDFAKATSSRSTKLVHGGLRYLRQRDFALVRESLRERGLLLQNAPHLVRPIPFIVPVYSRWEMPWYAAGLKLYDLLAGQSRWNKSQTVSPGEVLIHLPTLRPDGLRGGVRYFDGQFDDARLSICLAQTLEDLGGVPINYLRVESLLPEKGRVRGVLVRDVEGGQSYAIRARVVVNATGVFTDTIRQMDDPGAPRVLTLSQGAHIVLPGSFLPGDTALLIPRTEDGRVLFAIPWQDRTLVGTTDIPVEKTSLEPRPLEDEIGFLLRHTGHYLSWRPSESDVLSAFAGLRPLVKSVEAKNTARLSRAHTLLVSSAGLVTITGGKWTTYRQMGEDTVNEAERVAGLVARPSRTRNLALHGHQLDSHEAWHWAAYGADAGKLREALLEQADWSHLLHPNLPYVAGHVIWAARREMARTVEDVLARRTRALLLDARASAECAPTVAALLAKELGRDERWVSEQVTAFRALAKAYLPGGAGSD